MQQVNEVFATEEDEDANNEQVLADANLRLEQGTLYKMVMNSNLFADMDVDPRAVKNVEREIKRFARERMEVMLGMRQEKLEQSVVSSPFNSVEVQALKMLCAKMTGGISQQQDIAEAPTVVATVPKRTTLNTISAPVKTKPAPAPSKPLPKAAPAPIARAAAPTPPPPVAADKDEGFKPLEKPFEKLTEKEKKERIDAMAARNRPRAKANGAIPMPDADMMAFQYQQQLAQMPAAGQNAITTVMALLSKQK